MRKTRTCALLFLLLMLCVAGLKPVRAEAAATTEATLAAPKTVTADLYNYRRVTVKWSAVSKVYRYALYIKGGTYTSYTRIATTTSSVRSFTTKNLAANTTYKFAVRAYSKSLKAGKLSSVKTVTTLGQMKYPTVTQYNADYIKVAWTGVSGADGYIVSYSLTKDAKHWTKVTSSTSRAVYIKAKKDVAAYYRVLPFKLVNGTKVCGPWSWYRAFTAHKANTWYGNVYYGANAQVVTGMTKSSLLASSSQTEIAAKKKLIIVGASRVYYMGNAVGDTGTVFLAKRGQGYTWLTTEAYSSLRAWLLLFPNSTVVFQLGNNDYRVGRDNFDNYAAFYQKLAALYPNADFRYMDILPDQNEDYNNYALSFNERLHYTFPNNCIGGYDFFFENNLTFLADGTHYTSDSSRMIYRYILDVTHWNS